MYVNIRYNYIRQLFLLPVVTHVAWVMYWKIKVLSSVSEDTDSVVLYWQNRLDCEDLFPTVKLYTVLNLCVSKKKKKFHNNI